MKQLTKYISTALENFAGVKPGDSIPVYSRNSIWYPLATLSAIRIGAIACAVSPEYTLDELYNGLKLSKTKFMFTTKDLLEKAITAADKVGLPRNKIFLLDDAANPHHLSLRTLAAKGLEYRFSGQELSKVYEIPKNKTNHDVCAYICFSSGTTGMPKAVMISHANIIAQCLQMIEIKPKSHNKVLAALPFNHITGVVHLIHLPIVIDANVYVIGRFDFEAALKTVAENKIKELLLVPPILIRMVRQSELVAKYDLSHVQRFSSGAAPLSKEILTMLEKQFPGTGFKQGYGMTESCSCITAHPPFRYDYKYADKVGMLVSSTEVKIIHPENGRSCGVGEAGEVWARGPQVVMGYLDNPKATAETFDKDGFLHTGDIGFIDNDGMLSITDRMKEMIKVKGIAVAPAELENTLLGHPAVVDCAVCGIQDERSGERPKAFVVLTDAHKGQEEKAARDVMEFVRDKEAKHKALAEVEVVLQIPKSPSGKILRKILRKPQEGRAIVVVREEKMRARL